MRNTLFLWQLGGMIFTSVFGVLLHFLYERSNKNVALAPFSAINESIWEHMKLLFFPMLLFSVVENQFIGQTYENFWCVKFIGIVAGLLLVPMLFYTYTGALGRTSDWFNIVIFFLAVATSFLLETRLLLEQNTPCPSPATAIAFLAFIALLFIFFTFAPPHVPLFLDPMTGTYGIQQTK